MVTSVAKTAELCWAVRHLARTARGVLIDACWGAFTWTTDVVKLNVTQSCSESDASSRMTAPHLERARWRVNHRVNLALCATQTSAAEYVYARVIQRRSSRHARRANHTIYVTPSLACHQTTIP